jgi:Uma2 family endonuclease
VIVNGEVRIPAEVVDLDSFCRWACSPQFPQRGQFSFLHGEIWVDLTMEELYTHNQVKTEFTSVMRGLVKLIALGLYLADGMLLRNSEADLSTEPDGMFVSYEALRTGRVKRLEGNWPGYFQLEGTPEMVLEVISASSVEKDTVELRNLYWRAGIAEYWLVDARGAELSFNILKHGARGYTATRRQADGWLKSNVFARSFRLLRETDPLGDPQYILEVRE